MDMLLAESLVAVADAGTVTEAAKRIHISQSALSRRLQQLESELGARLVDRDRHGAELTVAGHLALIECRDILARFDALRLAIADQVGIRQGTVIVGGGATVTSCLLPSAIAAFRTNHPHIRFLVKEAGSQQILDDVAQSRVQIGFVTLPLAHSDVDFTPLVTDQIVLVARKDDRLRSVADPSELKGRGIIAFEAGSAIRRIVDASLASAGIDMQVTMELRSLPTMLQMVSATGDLAFVSALSLQNETELRSVQIRGVSISRSLAVAVRRARPLPPAADAFVRSLTTQWS